MYFCVNILHTVNSNALYINFAVMILVPRLFYLAIDNRSLQEFAGGVCHCRGLTLAGS